MLMKVLLDTNIIIHRETNSIVNIDIGQLFYWLDRLNYTKCIHPISISEICKHQDQKLKKAFLIKLESYYHLKTLAKMHPDVKNIIDNHDENDNDISDSKILNEVKCSRVDYLISEDNGIHNKAQILGIKSKIFKIGTFIEKVVSENPELIDYEVLSIRKKNFGNIDINDNFFDSFKDDYIGFEEWFNRKSDESAYVCSFDDRIGAFLYLKIESEHEPYADIKPVFQPKRRLKVGTFKVKLFGYQLGERFLKIIFDNAFKQKVDEIYITLFKKDLSQALLVKLLESYGFIFWGNKNTSSGEEYVYVRKFNREVNLSNPKSTFPFIPRNGRVKFVSIYPQYHKELFPDSKLRTENIDDFVDNEPQRNAIRKVYISHAYERDLRSGDILVFYRTGETPGRKIYESVLTTLGLVVSVRDNLKNAKELKRICAGRTALSNDGIEEFWNAYPRLKPFVINFLCVYSFPKRINLHNLIELGIIKSPTKIPRGIWDISWQDFISIMKETKSDESIISN